MPERPSVCRKADVSLSKYDIFWCSSHIREVAASPLQVRKSLWNMEVSKAKLPKFLLTHLLMICTDTDDVELTASTVSTFPFVSSENAHIFQDSMWKFFWLINCYSETLAWMLFLVQIVIWAATFSVQQLQDHQIQS